MGLDLSIFITYVGVILLIFVFGKLFIWPIRLVLRLALNSLLGGILLFFINCFGSSLGIMIPLNILNACITGVLGLPGVIMLLILTR